VVQKAIGTGTCTAPLTETTACSVATDGTDCELATFGEWGPCSVRCGKGMKTRSKLAGCAGVESEVCDAGVCADQCVPEFGAKLSVTTVGGADLPLNSPRAVDFSPVPGKHLGKFSSGRSFSTTGDEAWVANGQGHSVTIVTGVGEEKQLSLERFDRGWYHYMANISSVTFNKVKDSGRVASRDTFGYFATCQDNNNTYPRMGLPPAKDPNFFMGPSLYNSDPAYKNLVDVAGGECSDADECFLLHSDMLHESPSCPGILHDPETITAYGTVYWAIDGARGQLVRYDFSQPHGPGLMDHSFAAVRRHVDVPIKRAPIGMHMGMAFDADTRALYIMNTGNNEILRVWVDTGVYARTAREEYPIFSSRLPSFEYSIYECTRYTVFASGLKTPSGVVLHHSRLFVSEFGSGNLVVFDVASGAKVNTYATKGPGLMGLAVAPASGIIHGVNSLTNELLKFSPETACASPMTAYMTAGFPAPGAPPATDCKPKEEGLPNSTLFEQVHTDSGYADNNTAVQGDHLMDERAALLANRTDCEASGPFNFDSLLLGGYLCHPCLPDNCRDGGKCTNVAWEGYTCDNEFHINSAPGGGWTVREKNVKLEAGRTYRLIVDSVDKPLSVKRASGAVDRGVAVGILRVTVDSMDAPIALVGANGETVAEITMEAATTAAVSDTVPSSGMTMSPGIGVAVTALLAAKQFMEWMERYFK
jgi:hypothetical protein